MATSTTSGRRTRAAFVIVLPLATGAPAETQVAVSPRRQSGQSSNGRVGARATEKRHSLAES